MKEIAFIFCFWLIQLQSISQKLTPLPNPINSSSKLFEYNIQPNAIIFQDFNEKDQITEAKKYLLEGKFVPAYTETILESLKNGNNNTWIYFIVENTDKDTLFTILNGDIDGDSIWTLNGDGKILKNELIEPENQNPKSQNIDYSMYRRHILETAPNTKYGYLLKQSKKLHQSSRNYPLISDVKNYESKYFSKYNSIIYFYFFTVSFILCVICFIFLHFLNFKEKVTLYYGGYLLSLLFVMWRNFESVQPYFTSTLHWLPWFYTKTFHSAFIFIFYTAFIFSYVQQPNKFFVNSIKFIFILLGAIMVFEIPLIKYYPNWSYAIYYFSRQIIVIVGALNLYFIFKSTSYLARYLFIGSIILLGCDFASSFLLGNTSSIVATAGVIIEVLIFGTVLALRSYYYYKEGLTYQIQMLRLEKENETKALKIKTQIAQDIHDDLGLTVTTLKFLGFGLTKNNHQSNLSNSINNLNKGLNDLSEGLTEIVWTMNPEKDNLHEFLLDLRNYIATTLVKNQIKYDIILPNIIPDLQINGRIRRNILLTIKEILNNLIKHSAADFVKIEVISNGSLKIKLADNGIGFEGNPKNNDLMHGNGHKNIEKRIRECNGTVHFFNENGAVVELEVPIS